MEFGSSLPGQCLDMAGSLGRPGGFGQRKRPLKSQGVGSDSTTTVQTAVFAAAKE